MSRDEAEDPGATPWLLTRAEVEAMADDAEEGARLVSFEDFMADEVPPVRRFQAVFVRAAAGERGSSEGGPPGARRAGDAPM